MPLHAPPLDRTPSNHARYLTAGVRCFERDFEGHENKPPVKLVVFDCDETLTLSTFLPKDLEIRTKIGTTQFAEFIANVNFESPFVDGNRIEKMVDCLKVLKKDIVTGQDRTLAILTRNESGAVACLNLLMMAKLDKHFSAIWSMQAQPKFGDANAVYKQGKTWQKFMSPVGRCFDHKADVLNDVAKNPFGWLPQLTSDGKGADGEDLSGMLDLRPENIVLVDDVRTNFQSPSDAQAKVLRYCKVARYDSVYREMGLLNNMGGIGARNLDDYAQLEEFVASPWSFKESVGLRCSERPFDGSEKYPPVSLVVFDFDETLSIYTFMPEATDYKKKIGYQGDPKKEKDLVKYNFQTPYVPGDRVAKLRAVLERLVQGSHPRSLAVLTKNEDGAVAVLNLLLMANLADHFSAIWTLGAAEGVPNGVYRANAGWKTFDLPIGSVEQQNYKAFVLNQVAERPSDWFPQISDRSLALAHLEDIELCNIVDVDDERASFQTESSDDSELQVLRYCKVGKYDDVYYDQGLCCGMGGIGAKSDKDYETLATFVEAPWKCRMADSTMEDRQEFSFALSLKSVGAPEVQLERRRMEDDEKTPGTRKSRSLTGSDFDARSPAQ